MFEKTEILKHIFLICLGICIHYFSVESSLFRQLTSCNLILSPSCIKITANSKLANLDISSSMAGAASKLAMKVGASVTGTSCLTI